MSARPERLANACAVVSFAQAGAAAERDQIPRVLESRRFGWLEVYPDQVLLFPHGLLGFEELREFCIVAPEALQPLTFLVACDVPDVAFPILPAHSCLADYSPQLSMDALETVGAASLDEAKLLAICAVAPDTMTLHANLRGPILINPTTRRGYQAVLHESAYSLRHLLGAA